MKKNILVAMAMVFSTQVQAAALNSSLDSTIVLGITGTSYALGPALEFLTVLPLCGAEVVSSTRNTGACDLLDSTFMSSSDDVKNQRAVIIKANAQEVIAFQSEEMSSDIMGVYKMGLSIEQQRDVNVSEAAWHSLNQSAEQIHQTLKTAVLYSLQR